MRNVQSHPIKPWRRAGVPIAGLETADPARTILNAVRAMNGKLESVPLIQWDVVRAFSEVTDPASGRAYNDVSGDAVREVGGNDGIPLTNPTEALSALAAKAPAETVCFMHNAQRFISETTVMQAVWNCRDALKGRHALLVLLGPALTLPPELKQDVMVSSEALPDSAEISEIVQSVCKDAEIAPPAELDKTADVLTGLSAFAVEQVTAVSVTRAGLDPDSLWARKVKMIEQTPGLSVWRGGETFADIGGLDRLKRYLTCILTSGNTKVGALGFVDEIEKGLAGATDGGGDSGVSKDQLQVFLKVMQDYDIPGILLVGHAGTGKSQVAKAAGNLANVPVVAFDCGAMKAGIVGDSEARIRAAMDIYMSVSNRQGMILATCNKITSLPPELRRRYTMGTFFFDLPTAEERATIWPIWIKRFRLDPQQALPECNGWTGAEIRACCDVAFRAGLSLVDAADNVVPVCQSAPEAVEALRKLAHNRFLSASLPGKYRYSAGEAVGAAPVGRKITTQD